MPALIWKFASRRGATFLGRYGCVLQTPFRSSEQMNAFALHLSITLRWIASFMVCKELSSTVHRRIQPFVKRNIKSLPTDFAEGRRQAVLGKDQRARIVHRSMRVELGRVGKACPIEDQPVQLGLFGHPNERNVSKFSSDVAATDIRMSSREPDLLDDLRVACRRSRPERRNELVSMFVNSQCVAAVLHDIAGTGIVKAVLFMVEATKTARRELRGHQRCPIRQET